MMHKCEICEQKYFTMIRHEIGPVCLFCDQDKYFDGWNKREGPLTWEELVKLRGPKK